MTARTTAGAVLAAAVCLAAAACSGADEELTRIDPAPPSSDAPSAPTDGSASPSPSPGEPSRTQGGASADDGPITVAFAGAEAIDARDAAALARGDIPATLRLREEGSVVSTSLTCGPAAQRVIDVPLRRDGLVALRRSAQVLARLAGVGDAVVLGPRTDFAVVLLRNDRGAVRGRASAVKIDNRWFVGEVEDCR